MKRLFILSFSVFILLSCTYSVINNEQYESVETPLRDSNCENKVYLSDVLTLTHGLNVGTKSAAQDVPEVECIIRNSNDTVLFVCKVQKGGWKIYSSDTRIPAIVAQSESGSFDELMEVDGARLWIQSIADEMTIIKNLPDEKLNFTEAEIASNQAFWKSISCPDKYVKENLLQGTKVKDKEIIHLITGHYEYRYSTSYSEVYDSISRMTDTDWKQGYPYNIYCPLKSTSIYDHAPAGCVAIAGAQILYFLHGSYEVPETAPSEAYCYGDINSYTWDQTNYTSDIWNNMNDDGRYAAPLIANVGKRLNMDYGDFGSGAYTSDLVNNVFVPYGISCTYANYDTDLLKSSLLDSIPVLLQARSTHVASTGIEKVGHAFIADRYKRIRTVTKNYYEWVYDTYPPYTPVPMVPEMIEYTYSSPNVTMIGMNWGWGSSYNVSDEWFSLTGDWISSCDSSYNWNINRHMIYNFQIINN